MTTSTIDRFRHRAGSFFGGDGNPEGINDLEKFIAEKGMDYALSKVPTFVPAPDGAEGVVPVPNDFHIRRLSDGRIVSPASVTKQFGVMSPSDMLPDLIPFVDEGWATPDSAFTLAGGRIEVIALRLNPEGFEQTDGNQPLRVGEDFRWYLVAKNFHGGGSASASVFGERLICTNGMTALAGLSSCQIPRRGDTVKSFRKAFGRWEGIREVINGMAKRMGLFMDTPCNVTQATEIFAELLGITGTPDEDISTQKTTLRTALMDASNMPRYGTEGVHAADVSNAVTWVGSHWTPERSKLTVDDITTGLLLGTRGKREQKVLKLLDRFAGAK